MKQTEVSKCAKGFYHRNPVILSILKILQHSFLENNMFILSVPL